jgi:hypothetical protein
MVTRNQGVGKEANVRLWSRTVAIGVYLHFEHAVFLYNKAFSFLLATAELIGDYFYKRHICSSKL